MAIVNKPRLLIADEPTTALDVTVQAQILELLIDCGRSMGWRCCLSRTIWQWWRRLRDRVAVMRRGEIVEMAMVGEIFGAPQHEYTRRLLASVPTMRTDKSRPLASV